MPEISRFFGMIVTMYYNDHAPPHFHVRYASDKALIAIRQPALIEGHLSARALGLIIEWATLHREELLQNWDRAQKLEVLNSIEPLK